MEGTYKNWTAIFLLYSSNDDVTLDVPPNYDILKEIGKISSSTYCHLILIHHQDVFENGLLVQEMVTVSESSEAGKWRVRKEAPTAPGFLYDSEKLGTLFAWLSDHFPAKNKVLFTCGHGSGFGIFRRNALDQGGRSVVKDLLSNETLAKAIIRGFGRLEALVMHNCLMMNMHACYAFQDCVNYFVAPEANIVDPGYDYAGILERLSSHHPMDPRQVAMFCVESRLEHYTLWNWLWKYQQQAVFAIQLNHFQEFVELFNKHIGKLITFLDETDRWEIRMDIRAAVRRCTMLDVNGYQLFDLINWANYLFRYDFKNNELNSLLREMHGNLFAGLKALLLASTVGESAYTPPPYGWEIEEGLQPQGLGIHLPSGPLEETKETNELFIREKAPYHSRFLSNSPWLGLFQKLYKD